MQKIHPFLWFNEEAEEAAKFYTGIFKNSRILHTSYYGKSGEEVSGRKEGSVMTVSFVLDGQEFVALNGGSVFKFNEAVSFVVNCDTQEEVDYFWEKLTAAGGKEVECGWLKDKYGVSWQVVPKALGELMADKDNEKTERVMAAMLKMKKLDISKLNEAYNGS